MSGAEATQLFFTVPKVRTLEEIARVIKIKPFIVGKKGAGDLGRSKLAELELEKFKAGDTVHEEDFQHFIAKVAHDLGIAVLREQQIGGTAKRIDLLLPDYKIGIEVKLTRKTSVHSNPEEQR